MGGLPQTKGFFEKLSKCQMSKLKNPHRQTQTKAISRNFIIVSRKLKKFDQGYPRQSKIDGKPGLASQKLALLTRILHQQDVFFVKIFLQLSLVSLSRCNPRVSKLFLGTTEAFCTSMALLEKRCSIFFLLFFGTKHLLFSHPHKNSDYKY